MMAFSSGLKISLLFEMSNVHAHTCTQCIRIRLATGPIHNNSIIISFALTYFCSRSVVHGSSAKYTMNLVTLDEE